MRTCCAKLQAIERQRIRLSAKILKTKVWNERLNRAYRNLPQRLDAGQLDPLKDAQRLWIKYRDANCAFYGSQDGTIRQIQAAECVCSMTKDRALELENAMKFE